MKAAENKILTEIKQAVLAIDANAELILFGSRARGDNREDSDWDVLVLSNEKPNAKFKQKISDNLFYVGLNNIATIATIIINKENWKNKFNNYPLFYEVKKDGISI